jgi:hypothetical protein
MSIVQELTQGLATDKTKPSTSSVKVSQVLDNDGLNLNPWLYDLVNCGITKECIEAFQHPMPYTKANSAALHLLLSSIPKEFGYHVARMTAFEALLWITGKFQGGKDRAINSEWFRRLAEKGMTREDTLEQYVCSEAQRKEGLYEVTTREDRDVGVGKSVTDRMNHRILNTRANPIIVPPCTS